MYDFILPPLQQTLGALSKILTKAEAHCDTRKIEPEAILKFRLYPDMLNFTKQVQLTCDFAARMPPRLTGRDLPSFPDTETTFAELQARIAKALDYISGFTAADFDGAAERKITISLRTGDMTMSGQQFAAQYAIPQVYFHMTTAYDILRHNGVELGKRDYMGA
ncbi:MAG: DUF1993 domain-containing protein [Rhodobacteraceae bacterium]|nr:DUF1993 domain-containing protein [Paracoccaceae bacterium]